MAKHSPIQVIAVTGGKGGVGKSNLSVNVAVSMAQAGKRVLVFDGDLGLANIDVLLGVSSNRTIADVLDGQCDLRDILVEGPEGIRIIPASSGTSRLANMGAVEHAGIIHAFSDIADDIDVLIIDTAAGISHNVTSFVQAAQEAVLVVCDEPTSVTDAYALIKLLNRDCRLDRFNIVANMVRNDHEGQALFNKLVKVTERFLDVSLHYLGDIPQDEVVRRSVQRQKAVVQAYPQSKAAISYRNIAKKMMLFPIPSGPRGHMEFFVERLVGVAAN